MESRQDLASILPLLPLVLRSSSLVWPPKAVEYLKALSLGPDVSRVSCGKILFSAILELRDSVGLSGEHLAFNAAFGYSIFFDEMISREGSRMWFGEGFIEDQHYEALEVDFANERLGGGALGRGCVQEEIRFMINPELIVGMLFLPSMERNEAIEIIGTERFSNYSGYGSTFCFAGDYMDVRPLDSLRRRKTRIVAIDALCCPGMKQFKIKYLLRETNKAFCGFLDQADGRLCLKQTEEEEFHENQPIHGNRAVDGLRGEKSHVPGSTSLDEAVGVATGNWGCGAFGGDLELKSIIQWLAASQARRPFILYHTFGVKPLQRLEEVTRWILQHGWTVGDLWNMLAEYSSQRYSGETSRGFFNWLLPNQSLP